MQPDTTYETEVKDFFDIDRYVGVLSPWRTFPFLAVTLLQLRQERTSKTSIPSTSLPISKKNTCRRSLDKHLDRVKKKCWLEQVMKRFRFESFMRFMIQSPKYGTFTEAARTDPEKYSHDTWRGDKENKSVWLNSLKGFIENGLNNQELHPRHMNFCGIQRDVDEVLMKKVSSRRILGAGPQVGAEEFLWMRISPQLKE